MTPATYRALRESIGLTQGDVAKALGVSLRTVKRWEHPDWQEPPEDARAWLLDMHDRHDAAVDAMVDEAMALVREHGPEVVSITYYREQSQYDALGRDDGPYGFVNSIAREVALDLNGEGIETEFRYPDDEALRTPGSRC